MHRILVVLGVLVLVGCAPDGEEALALCREDAAQVLKVAASDQAQRKNRYVEHCMRGFGYTWHAGRDACGTHEAFRAGAPLSDDPALAATCFRAASERSSRLADYLSEWLE